MGLLKDPAIRRAIESALSQWDCRGYVTWKPIASEWVLKNLEDRTPKGIGRCLYQHVVGGGDIHQQRETREEWLENDFHYDFRILIDNRLLYVETVLDTSDSSDPTIRIVSIHDA